MYLLLQYCTKQNACHNIVEVLCKLLENIDTVEYLGSHVCYSLSKKLFTLKIINSEKTKKNKKKKNGVSVPTAAPSSSNVMIGQSSSSAASTAMEESGGESDTGVADMDTTTVPAETSSSAAETSAG